MFLLHLTPLGMLKHIETSWSFINGFLLWSQTQNTYQLSHSFSTSITNLLTGHSRCWRAMSVVPDVPSMSLTLLTNQFLSAFVTTIFAIGQLYRCAAVSLRRTISPTFQFFLMVFHFFRHWSVARTSFLHLLQNSLEMCCTLLQCLWQ